MLFQGPTYAKICVFRCQNRKKKWERFYILQNGYSRILSNRLTILEVLLVQFHLLSGLCTADNLPYRYWKLAKKIVDFPTLENSENEHEASVWSHEMISSDNRSFYAYQESVNVLQASLKDITGVWGGTASHLCQFLSDFHDFPHILSVE